MGASNNASSQNTAAQQQIQQAMQQALANWAQWQQANPFPLMNAQPPKPGPQMAPSIPGQQFGGSMQPGKVFSGGDQRGKQFGGAQFGGPSGLIAALLSAHANQGQGKI